MQVTNLDDVVNIADLAALARRRLPRIIFDFMDGGAEDERTLRANGSAFERFCFKPRILTGNSERDLSINLFGEQLAAPYLIGPTGLNGIYWPDGDLALSRAASDAGIAFALSTASNNSLEQVARDSPGPKLFQLYPFGDRAFSARMIERAAAAGYKALIITVDSLVAGKRERDLRNRFAHEVRFTPQVVWDGLTHPRWLASTWLRRGMPRFENIADFLPKGANAHALAEYTRSRRNPSLTWSDIEWMRREWRGPLLIKGVLTAEDARRACDAGADGVVISNHGGRALDGAPATVDVLPEIAHAAGGSMVVLIDSGFRRGSDIVKALALGAQGVLLGRATLYGLAAGGQAGVEKALAILRDEVDRVLALLGCASVSELSPEHVMAAAGQA